MGVFHIVCLKTNHKNNKNKLNTRGRRGWRKRTTCKSRQALGTSRGWRWRWPSSRRWWRKQIRRFRWERRRTFLSGFCRTKRMKFLGGSRVLAVHRIVEGKRRGGGVFRRENSIFFRENTLNVL